jgi:hypothetical protein
MAIDKEEYLQGKRNVTLFKTKECLSHIRKELACLSRDLGGCVNNRSLIDLRYLCIEMAEHLDSIDLKEHSSSVRDQAVRKAI